MAHELLRAQTWRFGTFEFDSRTGELRKQGIRIRLQEQPRQILTLLLEHRGELVTREQVQQRLWPDDTFVNFDNAINTAVRKLREALADNADNPRFVGTVARQGYRFLAPVSVEGHAEPEALSEALPAPTRGKYRRIAVAIACFFTVAVVAALMARRTTANARVDVRVVPLTANQGLEMHPSFSPDGTRLAYTWRAPGQSAFDLYYKLKGPGDPTQLTHGDRVFSPAWSPDGLSIAAVRDLGRDGAIVVMPATGGHIREVARVTKAPPQAEDCVSSGDPHVCGLSFWGSLLAWSRDGKYLFTSAETAPGSARRLVRIAVETGEVQPFTHPPTGSMGDFGPAVSPDGNALAFVRLTGAQTGDVYTMPLSPKLPLASSEPTRITNDHVNVLTPAWSSDGRELIFSSNRSGQRELWSVSSGGGNPSHLTFGAADGASDVTVSPDGLALAYNRGGESGSLLKIPIHAGRGGEQVRITAITARDKFTHISPDGKRIAFQSARSGVDEIWACDADGRNAVQLTSFGRGMAGTPRWSPDGRSIAFDSNAGGSFDVYVIPSEGGSPSRLTSNPSSDAIPMWSRDGAWIYFMSNRTGHSEVWKVRGTGGSETQVTTGGAVTAAESVDGKYLYVRRGVGDTGDLHRVRIDGSQDVKLLNSVRGRLFTVFERGIYFAAGAPQPELRYLDFATGSVRSIAPLNGFAHADVSPDEQWAVYPQYVTNNASLMLVENFRSLRR